MSFLEYTKSRVFIFVAAMVFAFLIFPKSTKNKVKSEEDKKEKIILIKNKNIKSSSAKTNSSKIKKVKAGCKIPDFKIKGKFPKLAIPVLNAKLLPVNGELKIHKDKAKLGSKVDIENVENYHLTGKIYLTRALFLQSIHNNIDKYQTGNFGITIPENRDKNLSKIKNYMELATHYLSAVRPVPKYRFWSQALYEKAIAYEYLDKMKDAVIALKIIGRTRSNSDSANYSRLSLALYYANKGLFKKSHKFLNKISKIDPKNKNIHNYVVVLNNMNNSNEFDDETLDLLSKISKIDFYIYKLFIKINKFCTNQKTPMLHYKKILSVLSPKIKNSFISINYKYLVKIKRKKLAKAMCKSYKK
jgi:tetratricopeptide (TPR) repeat protein